MFSIPLKAASFLLGGIALAIVIAGCSPAEPEKNEVGEQASSVSSSSALPASSSSVVASSPKTPFTRKTYYDAKTGFTFWHPARLTVTSPRFTVTDEVGYQINDPSLYGEIWVGLKSDTREKSNGPVTKKDVYAADGGNLSRDYVLYTGKYRVSVNAHYDVVPAFYEGKMGPDDSISDMVQKDLGGDWREYEKNPIQRLIALYPNEKTLKQFYQDADAIVKSMETEPSDKGEVQKITVDTTAPKSPPTEAVQTPKTAMSPKETYVALNAEIGNINTYADFEAVLYKYGSKGKIADFLAEIREIPEEQRSGLVPEIKAKFLSSEEIATIQESINGSSATLSLVTKNGPLTVTLVLENNQWKVGNEQAR